MKRNLNVLLLALTCAALTLIVPGCGKGAGGAGGSPADLQAQLDTLKTGDKDARINALIAIATHKEGAASAVPQLKEQLKDPDPDIRRMSAYALMEIGPAAKDALPELNALLQDEDRSVVMQVVNTIRAIQPGAMSDLDLQKIKDM